MSFGPDTRAWFVTNWAPIESYRPREGEDVQVNCLVATDIDTPEYELRSIRLLCGYRMDALAALSAVSGRCGGRAAFWADSVLFVGLRLTAWVLDW